MQRTFRSFTKNRKECKDCSVLLKRTEKSAKNVAFFYKERKRTQRKRHSFLKNGKERKNVAFFLKERMPNPAVPDLTLQTPAQLFFGYTLLLATGSKVQNESSTFSPRVMKSKRNRQLSSFFQFSSTIVYSTMAHCKLVQS